MKTSAPYKIIIAVIFLMAVTFCTKEDVSSCTFTPSNQAFSMCFDLMSLETDSIRAICDYISGEFKSGSCTTENKVLACSSVTIIVTIAGAETAGGVSFDFGLGSTNLVLYSPVDDVTAKGICDKSSQGSYVIISSGKNSTETTNPAQ